MPQPSHLNPSGRPARLGGVLIGGRSSRMGEAKHLMRLEGRSLFARTLDVLRTCVEEVFVIGAGDLPPDAGPVLRLADAPGEGPLAGILGAMLIRPLHSWAIAACDMPLMSREALEWLWEQSQTECAAVIPRTSDGFLQPLLAVYHPTALPHLNALRHAGKSISALPEVAPVHMPAVPAALADAWANFNTPDEQRALWQRRPN